MTFNEIEPEHQEDKKHCPVMEQKDLGQKEEACNKDVEVGCAGLCRSVDVWCSNSHSLYSQSHKESWHKTNCNCEPNTRIYIYNNTEVGKASKFHLKFGYGSKLKCVLVGVVSGILRICLY